jgi:hypothetical protein
MKSQPGPPMTLGNAAAACVQLIVWCKVCSHEVEPDPSRQPSRIGRDSMAVAAGVRLWHACFPCPWRKVEHPHLGNKDHRIGFRPHVDAARGHAAPRPQLCEPLASPQATPG